MNQFKFEVIAMLLAPISIFLGIVAAIFFYDPKIINLPLWMIVLIIVGFVAACAVIFFYVKKMIRNINSKND